MKADKVKWLLEDISYPEQEAIDLFNEGNDRYVFDLRISEMRSWREKKCTDMLSTIDAIFLADYHRGKNAKTS